MRLGAVKEIAAILREFGTDAGDVIRTIGLDPDLFSDGDNAIPFDSLATLLDRSVALTGYHHIGLLIGQRATLSSLGPIGGLMQHSPTVGDALRCLESHLRHCRHGAAPVLDLEGDIALLTYGICEPGIESADRILDAAIASATAFMRSLCCPDWAPTEVFLTRSPPADAEIYRRYFRSPVRFDQEITALTFPTRWLDHRIDGADAIYRRIFRERVEELEATQERALTDDLRRVLRTRILAGRCSADSVAGHYAVHRRTLNRRLNAEGTGYRHLTHEIRFEIARQLLSDTTICLSQVAAALGYSEASAFTRAFRRWSGQTPTAWRASHRRI